MAYGQRPPGCPSHIDAVEFSGDAWPTDQPFPLTAEEALWTLMGYSVLPASGPISYDVFYRIPGRWELAYGRLMPR